MDDKLDLGINNTPRNVRRTSDVVHVQTKEDLAAYMLAEDAGTADSLWCPEFNECIGEVLEAGAKKYAPRDWEQPDGYSMGYKSQCDAIFHHLAREFVYKENLSLINKIQTALTEKHPLLLAQFTKELLQSLKYDEIGTRHLQHAATRSVMSHTREKRGLK